MSDLIELNDSELMMVAGGAPTVGPITVQNNVNVNPQVAIGVAVLSPGARVNANNFSYSVQVNAAVTLGR
jgi:hypothetical protein